jgi:hypothetical protein
LRSTGAGIGERLLRPDLRRNYAQLAVRGDGPIYGAKRIAIASVSGIPGLDDRPMPGDTRRRPVGGVFAAVVPGGFNRNEQESCPPQLDCLSAAASAIGQAPSVSAAPPGRGCRGPAGRVPPSIALGTEDHRVALPWRETPMGARKSSRSATPEHTLRFLTHSRPQSIEAERLNRATA